MIAGWAPPLREALSQGASVAGAGGAGCRSRGRASWRWGRGWSELGTRLSEVGTSLLEVGTRVAGAGAAGARGGGVGCGAPFRCAERERMLAEPIHPTEEPILGARSHPP